MPREENGYDWLRVSEWADPEIPGSRGSNSEEVVRRHCRQGNLNALNAGATHKRGKFWELRVKPLTMEEIMTEQGLGAYKRLEKLGVSYDSRAGTWHYQEQVAYLMK